MAPHRQTVPCCHLSGKRWRYLQCNGNGTEKYQNTNTIQYDINIRGMVPVLRVSLKGSSAIAGIIYCVGQYILLMVFLDEFSWIHDHVRKSLYKKHDYVHQRRLWSFRAHSIETCYINHWRCVHGVVHPHKYLVSSPWCCLEPECVSRPCELPASVRCRDPSLPRRWPVVASIRVVELIWSGTKLLLYDNSSDRWDISIASEKSSPIHTGYYFMKQTTPVKSHIDYIATNFCFNTNLLETVQGTQ